MKRIENKDHVIFFSKCIYVAFILIYYSYVLKYVLCSILSYGQFLVTNTPWSKRVRIKEVPLY